MTSNLKIVFFGSSTFSTYVRDELVRAGLEPVFDITNAKEPIPQEKLDEINADLYVVASFGKILKEELINTPKHKTLNVHPSLLPELRGPAPIQGTILEDTTPGVSIMLMDKEMDHGPLLAKEEVKIEPWPDHYAIVEAKLGRAGGKLLAEIIPAYTRGEIQLEEQDHSKATYTKMIKKEDGLLDLHEDPEKNLRKVLAYSTWPGAHFFFKRKDGKEIRVVVKSAEIKDGKFVPTKVVPEGKKEMGWQDFLRGNQP